MINRVILIVIDSVGIGSMTDADKYDDLGCNTLCHVKEANGGLKIPNMEKIGIGNIDGIYNIEENGNFVGCVSRLKEMSNGKDTITGHWEMTGIFTKKMFGVYPNGFPSYIIDEFVKRTGVPGVLGNKAASGTDIIKELGVEHAKTRKPIVYTSADSVFQIACNEDVYSLDELYEQCRIARKIMRGKDEVARVIARPFVGRDGVYERTPYRRDYAIEPDKKNVMEYLKKSGLDVIAVGKIEDIFAKVGVTEAVHTKDNQEGIDITLEFMRKKNKGLIFTNLVEFDSKWGHRNDYKGYAKGLEEFDARLDEIMEEMKDDDLLIITADHGCDPTTKGTDHTREYVPLMVYGKQIKTGINMGTRESFADIGATISQIFNLDKLLIGNSFLSNITK